MRTTAEDLMVWMVARLRNAGVKVYETVAPQGTAYPYAIIELIGSKSDYTMNGESGTRIDVWSVQISSYDNRRLAANSVIDYDNLIGQLLENQFNKTQGNSVIVNADRTNTIGPLWLDHENIFSFVSKWNIRVTTVGTGSTS